MKVIAPTGQSAPLRVRTAPASKGSPVASTATPPEISTLICALPTGFQIEMAVREAFAAMSVVEVGPAVTATAVGAPQVMPPAAPS